MDLGVKLCDFVHFLNFYEYLFSCLQNGASKIHFAQFDNF